MFERFTVNARAIVIASEGEARASGARRIEAEQLLLAITAVSGSPAERLLAHRGLTHESLLGALQQERDRSLAHAGLDAAAMTRPPASASPPRFRFGTSAKSVLARSLVAAKRRSGSSLEVTDVLHGILEAETGTVPRALALAGIDRKTLLADVEAAS